MNLSVLMLFFKGICKQRYFIENSGETAKIGIEPDVFGNEFGLTVKDGDTYQDGRLRIRVIALSLLLFYVHCILINCYSILDSHW